MDARPSGSDTNNMLSIKSQSGPVSRKNFDAFPDPDFSKTSLVPLAIKLCDTFLNFLYQ
jgi:hypothetical protein